MATTIQISNDVKQVLDKMKLFERETYNEVIEVMIEDNLRLNEKTKREIKAAIKRIDSGDFVSQEEVERSLGL